jgi:hypothetical protein
MAAFFEANYPRKWRKGELFRRQCPFSNIRDAPENPVVDLCFTGGT